MKMKLSLAVVAVFHCLSSKPVYGSDEKLNFGKTITSCLSENTLWAQLTLATQNSTRSQIWPNNLSRMVGSGLVHNSEVRVSYRTFLSWTTYSYTLKLPAQNSAAKAFTYQANASHPFEGGATVQVLQRGNLRDLLWSGSYLVPKDKTMERNFFNNYSKSFFRELEANIRRLERQTGCQISR